jgi:signal transduction histidine kinase
MKIGFGTFLLILFFSAAYPAMKKDTIPAPSDLAIAKTLLQRSRQLILKNPAAARKIAEQALVYSKKTKYDLGVGNSFNTIAVSYWVQSFIPVSQFYLTLAVPYLKTDKVALSGCYRNMARNYVELKDYDQAASFFEMALELAGNNVPKKAEIYTEYTSLYNAKNDYDNGLKYIDTAFKYSRLAKNDNLLGILYNRLGQIYIKQGRINIAEKVLDTCKQIALTIRNKRLRSVLMIDQSRLSILKNNFQQAITYANGGYLLADTLGSADLKLRALTVLDEIYEKQGNLRQALQMKNKAGEIYRQIAVLNNEKSLQLIKDYFVLNDELNRKEQASINNNANEALIHTQHRTIALLVASLITALTFMVVIFIYYKEKHQLNNKLQAQHKVLLEQKKLIEIQRTDLEEVNKLKDKLLAIIGHDLRTPIASLTNIADMFSNDYLTTDEVKKIMVDIAPIVKGAELTLSNLIDFAGNQIKGQNVSAGNINICEITDEMKETFGHQLQQKNISLTNKCIHKTDVWVDPNHIKVIMRNLISNAIKFTKNGGRIVVISEIKNGEMEICIDDNGVGMNASDAEKLFKSNQHFSQRGTLGETGTGLGLLLCKELIELNKGKLWVEAIYGEGCRFYFTLPLSVDAAVENAV